jgi:hypothetical protein
MLQEHNRLYFSAYHTNIKQTGYPISLQAFYRWKVEPKIHMRGAPVILTLLQDISGGLQLGGL